jgi:hypothetical protein
MRRWRFTVACSTSSFGRSRTSAFIDLGDQFLALQKGRTQAADDGRHFGLVVDDKTPSAARWRKRAWTRYPVSFSISSIRGATV